MTSLQIVPKWKDKSARFKGTVAAGEHVAVSIVNDNGEGGAYVASTEHLRLRVVGPDGRVLAQFPMPETSTDAEEVLPTSELETEGEGETEGANTWDSDTTPLQCELNLNTVQMLRAVPPGANVSLLFVLDDIDAKTLYFKEFCEVTHWPRRCGEDEPVDLDGYADFVANITEEIAEFKTATNAAMSAESEARSSGDSALNTRLVAAEAAITSLGNGKADAATTLGGYGITDAKIENGTITLGANTITPLTQHQDISGKADLQNGKVPMSQLPSYVDDVLEYDSISEFPATGEEGKIYVAKDTNRTYRWSGTQYTEIANPALDNAVTHNSANGVKSSGIWAAIWGALTALPTGITSLYDWCVSQLAGKASTADATLTPVYSQTPTFSEWTLADVDPAGCIIGQPEWSDGDSPSWIIHLDGTLAPTTIVQVYLPFDATNIVFDETIDGGHVAFTATRTRTDIVGYQLGSQSDKPLQPKGSYAAATHTHAQSDVTGLTDALAARPTKTQIDAGWWSDWTISPTAPSGKYIIIIHDSANSQYNIWIGDSEDAWKDGPPDTWIEDATGNESTMSFTLNGTPYTATRHRVAAPVPTKPSDIGAANRAANPTAGNLAALDAQGNPTDSTIPAANVATKGDLRYSIVSPVLTYSTTSAANDTAAATLNDRAINDVTLGSSIAYATFTFPATVTGKARDFILRLTLTGETVPTITFREAGGAAVSFDANDDAWAEVEQGVNVISFTDTSEAS